MRWLKRIALAMLALILLLVGAVLMEQNDDWIQGKRYMTLETMAEIGGTSKPPPPALPA